MARIKYGCYLLNEQHCYVITNADTEYAEDITEESFINPPIKMTVETIDAPIGRHPNDRKKMAVNEKNGKRAVTHYTVLEHMGKYTYIECQLETGRTHQIRVHMASMGHPLLGDTVYTGQKQPFHLNGQVLHAMTIGFVHPRTGEYMEFEAPLPDYFMALLEKLRGVQS